MVFNFNNGYLVLSIESIKIFGNNIKNEEILIFCDKKLFIFVILLNIFLFLIVLIIFGLCIYCKRKWIIYKMFENDEGKSVYNGNGLYVKGCFFREYVE